MSHDVIAKNSLLIAISNKNIIEMPIFHNPINSQRIKSNPTVNYSQKYIIWQNKQKGCEQVHFIIIFPTQEQLHQKTTTDIHSLMTKVHM